MLTWKTLGLPDVLQENEGPSDADIVDSDSDSNTNVSDLFMAD